MVTVHLMNIAKFISQETAAALVGDALLAPSPDTNPFQVFRLYILLRALVGLFTA